MGHAHSHSHEHSEAAENYFLDQLCTVAVCAALGVVAVVMFQLNKLNFLASSFWVPVFVGGLLLIALAIIRAGAVWHLAAKSRAADAIDNGLVAHEHASGHNEEHNHEDHGHEHSHSHGHEHGHSHAHSHSHAAEDRGRDHGWAPWRYIVMLVPVLLFALGLPNAGFSNKWIERNLGKAQQLEGVKYTRLAVASLGGAPAFFVMKKQGVTVMRFSEMAVAAIRPTSRKHYEGTSIQLKGMYSPIGEREFRLVRLKKTCCDADAIPLQARIISPTPLQSFQRGEWVTVTGELQFHKVKGQNEWVPVVMLDSEDQVHRAEPDNNEYEGI
jgi:hypothetical protein